MTPRAFPGEPLAWWRDTAALRAPDFVIGTPEAPYLRRWFLVPRNPVCNVYLHQFLRSDDDRALHDHPWASTSFILEGYYLEHLVDGVHLRSPGDSVSRDALTAHRVELVVGPDDQPLPAWSLFITGPRLRDWGFHCPQGWRPWQEFTAPGQPGQIGPGCG